MLKQVAQLNELVHLISSMAVPTIAVLHGKVIGGGLALATAASQRLCLPDTTLNVALLPLGKSPVLMLMDSLPKIVGQGVASSLYLENGTVGAERAVECGLVDRLVSVKSDGERLASKLLAEGFQVEDSAQHVNQSHSAMEAILLADLVINKKRVGVNLVKSASTGPARAETHATNLKSKITNMTVRAVRVFDSVTHA